jgi:hypothetical protein
LAERIKRKRLWRRKKKVEVDEGAEGAERGNDMREEGER